MVQQKEASMPVIQCDIRQGRTEEQKRALAREITRVVH
jgi:phenylpyruvate tautomerase PptA (4-oxalocrotonate tautomerase family)